jgi:prepilin-type N-terminal cleavage/methylation domain-containing protein
MNNKGFTMIEVIAIIALLGIILVISMPKFFSMR